MSFTAPQVESRIDKSYPYTILHVEQGQAEENREQHRNGCDEFCGTPWRIVQTIVGLIALVIFCIMNVVMNYNNLDPFSNAIPPKFFLQSLHVPTFTISDGELSATWDVKLTISNSINATLLNFVKFQAIMFYKQNKELALNSPIKYENLDMPGIFKMDPNENKTLHLKFSITGWEKNQPIVDDSVLGEIAEDRKRGIVRFGLKIMVEVEIKSNIFTTSFKMYPVCSNLEVHFASPEQGGAAALFNDNQMECLGPLQWEYDQIP